MIDERRQAILYDDGLGAVWRIAGPALQDVIDWLRDEKVTLRRPALLSPQAYAVLLAEACNWAAKVIHPAFYDLKPAVLDEVAGMDEVVSGWGEDGCFYLFHDEVGATSYHDPYDEVNTGGRWPFPWSGVRRQHLAFRMAGGDEDLIWLMAVATTPWRATPEIVALAREVSARAEEDWQW